MSPNFSRTISTPSSRCINFSTRCGLFGIYNFAGILNICYVPRLPKRHVLKKPGPVVTHGLKMWICMTVNGGTAYLLQACETANRIKPQKSIISCSVHSHGLLLLPASWRASHIIRKISVPEWSSWQREWSGFAFVILCFSVKASSSSKALASKMTARSPA